MGNPLVWSLTLETQSNRSPRDCPKLNPTYTNVLVCRFSYLRMTDDFPSLALQNEETRFLLERQYSRYREIRDSTNRIFQLVLSIASLVISIGFLQLLTSGNVGVARFPIRAELANRCAPDALTHSEVSLHGIGSINYWLVGGVLILVIYLIVEMGYIYSQSQSLPTLKPQNRVELHVYDYSDFLEQNRIHLEQAREYLSGMTYRLYCVGGLYGVAVFLLINLYYSYALALLVADSIILAVGLGLLVYWSYQYVRSDEWEVSDWIINPVSPPFAILFAILLLFLLQSMYKLFLLFDYFFIC